MRSFIAALFALAVSVVGAAAQPSPPSCVNCAFTTAINTFLSPQIINLNASQTTPAFLAGSGLQIVGAAGTTVRTELDAYASVPRYSCVRWDGTEAAPTTLQSADEVCSLNAFGYNGTGVVGPQAAIRTYAAQNWSVGQNGTYLRFGVTPNGSATLTDRFGVEQDGSVTVGTTMGTLTGAGTINVSGNYYVNGAVALTTVNGIPCALGSTCSIVAPATGITYGTTTISGGTGVPYNSTNGGTMTAAALAANSVLVTNGSNVPSFSATLPSGIAATNMALTTPSLGVAAGTSLALGGATIGGFFLAVTGGAIFNSTVTFGTGPAITGTITGTYALGGTPSIAGSAINSGTISGSWLSAINLGASGNGGVTGIAPIANGGTGQSGAPAAITALMPVPTRVGDFAFWNGTIWTTLAGNNSGTQVFSEGPTGVPAWLTAGGTGTVTNVIIAAGSGIAVSGTCSITSTGTCTVAGAVIAPQGRITLAANTPVMLATSCGGSSCANQTTLRYDCAVGGGVPYFNGTLDLIDTVASCEVIDAMVAAASAGQVVGSQVYDVWWVHGGANRICLAMSTAGGGGGGWAADTGGSNTSRGTGYTVIDQITRPYPTNKNALANCFNGSTNYGSVAANQATYLGTVYAIANGSISYVWGSAAGGGGAAMFGVWNMYNQVDVKTTVTDTVSVWLQSGASAVRAADNSVNNRASFVVGLPLNGFTASYQVQAFTSASAGSGSVTGTCLDGTTCFDARALMETATANSFFASPISIANYPAVSGFHFVSATEENANNFGTGYNGGVGVMQLDVATRQ
jgi:hypothetical protein